MKYRMIFLVSILLATASSAAAAAPSPAEIAVRLQQVYDATHTLSAVFTQKTSLKGSSRSREGRGRLLLARPGRIRWDYETPDEQVIICDGSEIRMYFAASKQLIASDAGRYLANDITTSFFMGRGRIKDDFNISANPVEDSRFPYCLRLVPKKPHPQVSRIDVWLDSSYYIRRLVLLDNFGSVTEIELADIRTNFKVAADAFAFIPPEGTEIIRQ